VTKNHVPENQDTCLVGVDSSGRKIAIVSIDGAGGVTGGRAASTDANNGVAKYVKENRLSPKDSLIDVAAHAITEAPEERHGMACVASVIVDGKSGDVGIEHIGDSGVMVLRNFKEIHTTRPHSIAESFQKRPDMQTKLWEPFEINKTFWERIARIIGQPKNEAQLRELQIRIQQSNTPETIFNSPMLHAVERAIAPHQDTTSSERSEFHGENGDLIVQGSDALWKSVSSYEIQKWCVESGGDQQKLEAKIYAMVYERNNSAVPFQIETSLGVFTKVNWKAGKGDNITVLVTKLKNLPERKSAPVPEPVTQQPEETEKEPIEDTVPSEPRTIESEDRGAEEIILKTLERMELKEELGTNFFVKELKKIGWPTHDAEKDKQTLAVVVYTTINLLLGRLRGTFKDKGIRFESDGTPHLGVWNRNKKRATLEEDPDYKGLNQLVLVYRRLTEDSPRGFMNRVRSVWGRTDTKLAAGITVGTIAGIGLSGDNTAPTEIVRPVQSLAERGDHSSQADDSPFIVAEPTKAVGQPREEKETYASKPRFGIEFAPGVTTMHTELRAQKPKPIEQIAVVPQATIPPVKERETELDDPTNHKSKKRRTTPLSTQEPRDRTRASQARKAQTENKIPTTGQNVVTGSGENKDQDERQRMDMNEYE
jgi:serine/threonine protein phosphatase PrpC